MLCVRFFAAICSLLVLISSANAGAALSQEDSGTVLPDTFYEEQVAAQGLRLIGWGAADLLGDGSTETVLVAISQDCGSCHAKYLSVYAGSEILLNLQLDDPDVSLIPGVGLQITEPVRLENEGFCCPSQFQTRWYTFDAVDGRFHPSYSPPAAAQRILLTSVPLPPLDASISAPAQDSQTPPPPALTPSPPIAENPWSKSPYCASLGERTNALYNFADPDLAWRDVATAHAVSLDNPILRQSGYQYRGRALIYALWINRALQPDAVSYIDSLGLCTYLHHAIENGDTGEIVRALGQLDALVPRLWCEQIKLRVRGPSIDPRLYNSPDGRYSYLLDLRDAFGGSGEGFTSIVHALALPSQGDNLAHDTAEQWRQRSVDILRTMDVAQCASE